MTDAIDQRLEAVEYYSSGDKLGIKYEAIEHRFIGDRKGNLAHFSKWEADRIVECWNACIGIPAGTVEQAIEDLTNAASHETFQSLVHPWLVECFGEDYIEDKTERIHRFVEESLELAQACGCSKNEALHLITYVFSREVGEKHQEVGGVMTTLAALCQTQGINMHEAGLAELNRVWNNIDKIRAKQDAKPSYKSLESGTGEKSSPQAGQTRTPEEYERRFTECLLVAGAGDDYWNERFISALQKRELTLALVRHPHDCDGWYTNGLPHRAPKPRTSSPDAWPEGAIVVWRPRLGSPR